MRARVATARNPTAQPMPTNPTTPPSMIAITSMVLVSMYSKTAPCSEGRSPTGPGCTARWSVSRPLVAGMSRSSSCWATLKTSRPTAATSAAIAARGRWRASQARFVSTSCVTVDTLVARRRGKPGAAHRIRRELAAGDDPRDAVAGVQDEVQRGRGEPDQPLDPSLVGLL